MRPASRRIRALPEAVPPPSFGGAARDDTEQDDTTKVIGDTGGEDGDCPSTMEIVVLTSVQPEALDALDMVRKHSLSDLKRMCTEKGCSNVGRKAELAERLEALGGVEVAS